MQSRLDPAVFAKAVMLESSDIPPHMTLAQWRREKRAASVVASRARRRRALRALRRRAR